MSDFDALRADLLTLISQLSDAAGDAPETRERLGRAAGRLRDGRLTVLVCGEFKRGKSSLINALLGETEPLMPVDTVYTTNAIITASYGERLHIVAHLDTGGDGDGLTRRELTRSELVRFAAETENAGNKQRTRLVEITLPNPRLASGLTFVDTPGVGGALEAHTATTMGYLTQADAVLFVGDTTQIFQHSELTFLRTALDAAEAAGDADAVVFVLTHRDLGSDHAEAYANNRAKLAALTGVPAEDLPLVVVSSTAYQNYLLDGDPEDLEMSNFPALESVLWGALARRRIRSLLGGGAGEAADAAAALLRPVVTEIDALTAGTAARLQQIRDDIQRSHRRIEELKHSSGWRNDLARELDHVGARLLDRARDELSDVWHRVDTDYLYDERLLADPQRLVGKIGEDGSAVVGVINRRLQRDVSSALESFGERHGFGIGTQRVRGINSPAFDDVRVTGRLGADEKPGGGMTVMRDGAFGMGAGAMIGGSIFGPPGALIGAGIGLLAGLWRGKKVVQHQDWQAVRASLRTELSSVKDKQKSQVLRGIKAMMADVKERALADLESRLRQESESVTAGIAALERAATTTREDADRRLAELGARRAPLDRAVADAAALTKRVVDLASGGGPVPSTGGSSREPADDGSWADE
ncbi:dynamin family protein [Actinoplanes bogorensis]|uniref:Dynamin family protein n=1 Tax=Paractinoplanes bogorensis TaxID=1610840 RepID=A0ABS5YUN4_9ACTN|nr:dynamin family protein [Actinoplanes bogorensis]MBU2667169.1 dynamin family protein [Actinoplanes bogorensis]